MCAALEDDSWADGAKRGPSASWQGEPPIRRPSFRSHEAWNRRGKSHQQSLPEVEDDSWADAASAPCSARISEEPPQVNDDAWADQLPMRHGSCGSGLAAPARARAAGPAVLEDDSWADGVQRQGGQTDAAQIPQPASGRAYSDEGAEAHTANRTKPATHPIHHETPAAAVESKEPVTNESKRAEAVATHAATVSSAPTEVQINGNQRAAAVAETTAVGNINGSRANGQKNKEAAPHVPEKYVTFAGRVCEFHVTDKAAGKAFAEAFSLERFRAAFPEAQALPLLVGLDFEWKPDRKPGDNNPIALMQMACWDTAFIVRTTGCEEMPPWLQEFLETGDEVVKVTASFDVADKRKLQSSFSWDFDAQATASSYADIAELAVERSIPYGMLKMANFFDLPMLKLKAVGSSNWAREAGLTAQQREYAADDAFFQLFLLGKLLQHRPPEGLAAQRILESWQVTHNAMEQSLRMVDNSAYQKSFFELRDVVRNAVDVLSKALGSGGCTNINDVNRFKAVQKAVVTTQRICPIPVNAHFLRQNNDLFVIFFRDGQLRVRLRLPDDSEEEDMEEGPEALSEEDAANLVAEVQELLAAYEPPVEKRRTVLHRNVPEAFWVPARAILTRQQTTRLEACLKQRTECIEASYDGEDGLLLRLARHPRAADDAEHMEVCVVALSAELAIDQDEAKCRLSKDDKFMQFWSLLRTVEVKSTEEASIARCLRARSRILADAQRLAARVSNAERGEVSWEAAKEELEKVKWYRQLLGDCLGDRGNAAKVEECLGAVAAAWPNVKDVIPPHKQKRAQLPDAGPDQKRRKTGGGKGKTGKSKGKSKGTEK